MKHWKRIIAVFALCMLSVGLISAQPALASNFRHEELLWEELLWELIGGAGTKERDESDQSDQPNQPDTEKTGWVYENGLWHYYKDGEVHSAANMLLSFPDERDNGGSAIGENRPERRIIGIGIPEYNTDDGANIPDTDDGAIIPDTLSSDSGPDVLPAGSALIVSKDYNGVNILTQSEFNLILEDLGYAPEGGYDMTPERFSALFTNLTPAGLVELQQRINQLVSERSKDPDAAPVKVDLGAIFLNGENGFALLANTPMNLEITGNLKVDAVFLATGAADSTVTVKAGSSVDDMTIGAAGSTVHVEAGGSVGNLVLDAPDATVTADGTVQNVTLTGNGMDAKLDGAGIQEKIINANALKVGKTADITLKVGQRAVIPIKCGKNANVTVNVTITPLTAGTPVIEGLDGAFASAGDGQYTASLEDVAFRKFKVVIDAKEDMSFSISMTGIEADGEETDASANQQEDGNAAESRENTAQSSGHTHVWSIWMQTTAPTCTEKGEETRACHVEGCGETETRPVDVIAHDWDTSAWITDGSKHWHKCKTEGCTAITDEAAHSGGTATCQAKAICAVCNQPYGEVADHDWDTSAWITDGSKHWHKCKTPGCTAITDEAAHSGGTATCQEKAVCDVCKQPYGEFGEHKMEIVEPAVEPTCESPGMTAYYRCSVCEEAEIPSEEYGEPLNHDWAETLTQGDTTHYYACSRCEARKDEAPHSGGTATCQAKAKCAVCGKEYGELADHDWDTSAWITDGSEHWHKCKTPGCTAITDEAAHSGGTATCQAKAKCEVCGEEYGMLGEHDWDTSAWITDCYKHWHKCKTPGCSAITDEAEIPSEEYGEPLNHKGPFALVSQTPATCVSPGLTLSKCEACGKEIREETPIDPNAHNNLLAEQIPGKAATCTETGLTNGERCPDCKAILTAQKEIPALTHDWGEWKQTKAPTCLEAGDETRTCKRDGCGATETRPVDVIAHDWDTSAWITDGSKHWHKCKTPGCTAITDEAAHSGGMATCQAKAKCAVCGEDYGEKSTGNHAGGTKKVYYTEGDTGYEYYVVCLSCGEKTGETGVTPYDDETFDPNTVEWDYGEILVPGS